VSLKKKLSANAFYDATQII